MTGPAGSGGSAPAAKAGGLLGVINAARSKRANDSSASLGNAEDQQSKHLPATGLKRNTKEWKEEHPDEDGEAEEDGPDVKTPLKDRSKANGDAQPARRKQRSGSESSSSSIPSEAEREDEAHPRETAQQREQGQEGATGRGPGRHEPDLSELGARREGSPEQEKEEAEARHTDPRLLPSHTARQHPADHQPAGAHEFGDFDVSEPYRDSRSAFKQDDNAGVEFMEEERMESRSSARNRKMTDELGRLPAVLAGVKEEEKPGPRNEIVLEPRVSHMHYHQQIEPTGKGLERGPILKITPDGEAELPPGQTPGASRQPSFEAEREHATEEEKRYEDGLGRDVSEGTWRSANGPGNSSPSADKGKGKRWSSFRTDAKGQATSSGANGDDKSGDGRASKSRQESTGSKDEDRPRENGHARPSSESTPGRRTDRFRPPGQLGPKDQEYVDAQEVQEGAQHGWQVLRQRILPSRNATGNGPVPGPGKVSALASSTIAAVPVTTELMAGQLPVMMLKTWLDRDEDGNRAVPVLLGNLRFRVGDSVGVGSGRETGKEMFKLECEYGDGAVKWVIYRELRDFLSLHAHYKAAVFGSSVGGLRSSRKVDIPEFPRMSIPYLNKVNRGQGKLQSKQQGSKSEHAQASRDALQQYLVELIRAVIFRPESNRLCKFFELSSLTLSLAPRGGFQGKAGFLKMPGSNTSRRANQPGLTPGSWLHYRSPKWFIIRDSYFVATEGPEATELYDVFMLDGDFSIERPRRVYRRGFLHLPGHKTPRDLWTHNDPVANITDVTDDMDPENPLEMEMAVQSGEGKGHDAQKLQDDEEHRASQHTFYVINSQRRLKLVAKNARQMHQFIVSMERIAAQSPWTGRNRFDSFAPLRVNVAAQWLVDGRDYFWNLSRAINMAKDRIYIHDWWLSPELYLRRPGDERYRLDNLLKRKAEEGVKIFIIIYNEVSDKTTPVDSTHTKKTLSALHPNILVQRSPSHFQTGTFYWSHHEKMCVIDETIGFMGGLDLCYGRWDTSQHVLTDEDHTAPDGPDGPVWRGKDYSNERVVEFSALDKPFEDSIDRSKVPRMPWHDVGLQIVGQPARDLCRHFVQRWNLLIRTKNHKRKMPFLLPAADFTEHELGELKLQGTCEVQICRSVGPWSMGTLEKIEHSIQNAYTKSIELSEHFVYIENQFFITSTVVDGVRIENSIGDALVNRAIRAHKEGTPWKACIVIPLLPGYTYPIDAGEASSVRLILECQNRTIARGTNSIFSRLRKEGLDPDEYITFFSLRGWSKFKNGALCTEQVYIHGKTCIIDDRLVLCGSANINERSQRGDRDSELLAVIRDTDMIDGTMAGQPFKVGRFAHTLRMRLMREHVGVDVDSIEEDQLMTRPPVAGADEIETWDPDHEQDDEEEERRGITKVKKRTARDRMMQTVQSAVSGVTKGMSENTLSAVSQVADKIIKPVEILTGGQTIAHRSRTGVPEERKDFSPHGHTEDGFASSVIATLEEKTIFERRPSATHANGAPLFDLIEEGEAGVSGTGNGAESKGNTGVTSPSDGTEAGPDLGHPSAKGGSEPAAGEVPPETREGNTVVDENPDASTSGVARVRGKPEDKELYGAPANAVPNDDAVPRRGVADEDRSALQRARDKVDPISASNPQGGHGGHGGVGSKLRDVASGHPHGENGADGQHADARSGGDPEHPAPHGLVDGEEDAVKARQVLRKHLNAKVGASPWNMPTPTPIINPNRFHDPLDERFWKDMWVAVAVHNTEIFRKVFRCIPDDLVTSWSSYKAFANHAEKFNKTPEDVAGPESKEPPKVVHDGPGTHGAGGGGSGGGAVGSKHDDAGKPSEVRHNDVSNGKPTDTLRSAAGMERKDGKWGVSEESEAGGEGGGKRDPSGPNEAWHEWEKQEMEALLGEVRGHLVLYSTRFLEAEDLANNFLFNSDKILPLPIYD